ncbi:site-specific DNA-methyltransferase [Aquabacterium sp. G14]
MLDSLGQMSAPELRRLLTEHLTRQKLGLYWERDAIEHDKALNANVVLPRLVPEWSHTPEGCTEHRNLIIEGDNFDSLRLLRATHAGKVRVIYIDPPYNTGNKDWVYNDSYVGQNDRWRHSQWLEFLYQRLTLARDLLTSDGVILVSINDENRARLELLMDEVFPGRRVGCFVWRSRTGGNDTKGAFFSDNHEHVLVYANPGFRFSGDEKSYSMYKYQEGDRLYRLSDLTKAHDYRERPNTYYPIHDPLTDTFYPCNPQRVWAYASEKKVKDGQKIRGDTIETLIAKKLIWFPPEQRVEVFETLEELQDAIQRRDVPMSGSTPLLFDGMPDLDFWVGRRVGYGRPAFKRFKEGLKNENQPISSWLTPRQEQDTVVEGLNMPVVGTTEEGSKELKEVMGDKAFPYPKPPSLLKGLLAQATRPDDIVLDFFAGSGTTGQVVMELNVEDSGRRRFILCSSTEANDKEPAKNLCRDVCAERMRRVMQGYGDKDALSVAQGGEFAYLQLDKLDAADVALDATADHASTLLTMRHAAAAPVTHQSGAVRLIAKGADWLMALCPTVNAQVLDELCGLPDRHHVARLVVYAPRPKSLAALLAERGIEAQVHALRQALIQGQGGRPQ